MTRKRLIKVGLAGLVLALLAGPVAAEDRGEQLFALCSQCHMADGQGNPPIEAPAIAGLPAWYVTAQLVKFQTGARGGHPDDQSGLRMRPMSRWLTSDADNEAVAGYVASLPPLHDRDTIGGDPAKGAASYAVCASCHGAEGQGSEPQFAPPLVGQSDWYLLSGLQKFKAGIRGTNPADATGAMMRPMAMILPDDQAMRDVVAYIMTLQK
jgi:cytochrome c553